MHFLPETTGIYLEKGISYLGVGLHFFDRDRRLASKPLEFIKVDPGASVIEHTTILHETHCQQAMDKLWALGFRPTDIRYSNEQIQAINLHLSDMRKIVANKLEVEL